MRSKYIQLLMIRSHMMRFRINLINIVITYGCFGYRSIVLAYVHVQYSLFWSKINLIDDKISNNMNDNMNDSLIVISFVVCFTSTGIGRTGERTEIEKHLHLTKLFVNQTNRIWRIFKTCFGANKRNVRIYRKSSSTSEKKLLWRVERHAT